MKLNLNCNILSFVAHPFLPLAAAALFVLPALPSAADEGARGPIQDNSFLVEEAYNQETGVMQTIQTFVDTSGGGPWVYAVSQEFPVGGQDHQLSYTLPFARNDRGERGVGDLAVNYRYQLLGDGEASVACSPRVSLLVPTGNAGRDLGSGGWGVQVNIPVSTTLSDSFVTHTNVGGSLIAGARSGDSRALVAGQSLVWLAHPALNLMLETLLVRGFGGSGASPHTDVTLAPGVRFALDLPGGVQVVPGVAYTMGVGSGGSRSNGLFVYLSFEHPFMALAAAR